MLISFKSNLTTKYYVIQSFLAIRPFRSSRVMHEGKFLLSVISLDNSALYLETEQKVNYDYAFNPLPHAPILGSSNSAGNKDVM